MASTSTPYQSHAHVVLPSIREMFSEHLIPRSATAASPASASAFPRSRFAPAPPPAANDIPIFLFRRPEERSQPVVRTHPYNANSRAHSIPGSSDGDSEPEAIKEGECGDGESGTQEGKKHVCTTCAKRFNRPSSLRIHFNMHTGAMPFRCPHPSCGRAFNVSSNMRRHFRNHACSASASAPNLNSAPTTDSISPTMLTAFSPTSMSSPVSYLSSPTSYAPSTTSYLPTSTPTASRSASSGSSFSPAIPAFLPPTMFERDREPAGMSEPERECAGTLVSISTFRSESYESAAKHHARYYSHRGYSESDVRSERQR
ncbi:hypothetical protein B0H14DRAFT_3888265 [Mycena olivaceomarginata]|nr:hypothetical protein B0H14DRAFT_3888265 [Mycena olivaceomarginata]